ncbi:MAG: gliding motility lipoprotein GldB, partial [Bacteroidetes bacterium HGW-Bacteroidetes-9]
FTASFSQESPSRTGAWLGWQIVKSYMKNNDSMIAGLMANANSQEILEKSGYKPKKK